MTPSPDSLPLDHAARAAWDAVVIGGGPAGAVAAGRLAARGHRVLVLERHRPPRDKVCGDGLIADSLRMLDTLGLGDEVRRRGFRAGRVRIASPRRITFDIPGEFVTLHRRVLDALLLEAALARGACLAIGTAAAVEQSAGEVRVAVAGSGAPLRARFAMVATGADVSLLDGDPGHQRPSAVALRTYVRSTVALDELVVSFDRSIVPGYAWIFPMGGDEYNVGCGVFYADSGRPPAVNLREMFRTFVREFPLARRMRIPESAAGELAGARLRCGLAGAARMVRGRVVAAGEAIGSTFPFTGEGIGKAMETAALAAEHLDGALAADDPARLAALGAAVETTLRPRYLGYEVAQRWLARAWLSDLLAWRVTRSRRLREQVTGILNETVDPGSVFSLRGLLPSLVR